MIGELQCLVLDCADPLELARFYGEVLGGEVNRPDPRWHRNEDWATLHAPSGAVLAFQRVPDHRPPRWPDPGRPQQFHLDVAVRDLRSAGERVLACGATLLDAGPGDRCWHVYADPAGHPFCLVRR